ncbi:MAG TPA: hypothetical protein HPQ00_07575, partial [Magnetococcales bacterium]|nr:hypothetical protein [Magnetococcales bacterium]
MKKLNGMVLGWMVLVVGYAAPSLAADAKNGKLLHDASCVTQCHASRANGDANKFYAREN